MLVNLSSTCLICQAPLRSTQSPVNHLCRYCFIELIHRHPSCKLCDLPILNGDICPDCQNKSPIFDQNYSAMLYFDLGKRLLKRLKAKHEKKLLALSTQLLAHKIKSHSLTLDYLTHTPRFKTQEFSSRSSLSINIGFQISKLTKIPFKPFLINQIKEKPAQKGLSATSRASAVSDCYECKSSLAGKSVGVIDDILTTGATMNALAKTLKDNNAKNIVSLTLARTPKSK